MHAETGVNTREKERIDKKERKWKVKHEPTKMLYVLRELALRSPDDESNFITIL